MTMTNIFVKQCWHIFKYHVFSRCVWLLVECLWTYLDENHESVYVCFVSVYAMTRQANCLIQDAKLCSWSSTLKFLCSE